ncbi:hypothetical protein Dsin_018181 [Dipteronia sinensis]|uniref:Uncharacterized protein n=1 Tax=Dipteronia sinensis TaxID=43782 RepID=A0AAE0A4U5_9ROSI|nr:hypothetical protein Dsin_018181 [Dipteronia sinensis]
MAKTLLLPLQLSLLLVTCFTVFAAEDENIVSFVAMPPHHHSVSPAMAPSPHHHHHHHSHPPTSTPTPTPKPATPPPAYPPSHHHHHAHPPSKAPVHPPKSSHPPAHPPALPPHLPPTYPPKPSFPFPRKLVAVQGVVFLKSCKYAYNDTLSEATSLAGAFVKLQCNNTAKPLTAQAQTDKNGYFLLLAPKTITNYAIHKCKASLVPSKLPLVKKPSDLHGGVSGAILKVDKKKPLVIVNKVDYALFTVGPFAFEPKCYH